MSIDQWIGLSLALAVMVVGLIGCVVPGIPGTPLVLIAAVGHRLYFGEHSASWFVLILLVLLTLLSLLVDYLASVLGARKMGATWRGIVGAVIGGVVGLFFAPFGIFLGPFVGALAFELMGGRELREAAKAGTGALIGLVVGTAGKLACCLGMMLLFAINVASRSA